jgi:hypothetical protein
MVRKLLTGEKTQTRRILKFKNFDQLSHYQQMKEKPMIELILAGEIGTRLWVRERFRYADVNKETEFVTIQYSDDSTKRMQIRIGAFVEETPAGKWRAPIHMYRWTSRIDLDIINIRIERLQAISEEDAKAEGVTRPNGYSLKVDYKLWFKVLWDSLNEKRGDWDSNPFVIVRELRRVV